ERARVRTAAHAPPDYTPERFDRRPEALRRLRKIEVEPSRGPERGARRVPERLLSTHGARLRFDDERSAGPGDGRHRAGFPRTWILSHDQGDLRPNEVAGARPTRARSLHPRPLRIPMDSPTLSLAALVLLSVPALSQETSSPPIELRIGDALQNVQVESSIKVQLSGWL